MGVDEQSGFRLAFNLNTQRVGSDRNVEFDIEVTDTTPGGGGGAFVPLQTGPIPGITAPSPASPRRVEITPQNASEVQSAIRDQLQSVTEAVSVDGVGDRASQATGQASQVLQAVNLATSFNIPNPFNLLQSGTSIGVSGAIPRTLTSINSMRVDDLPFENQIEVSYNAIQMPEVPGERFSVDDLPGLEIQAELILENRTDTALTVEELPPEMLFETVDITDVSDCGELYSGVQDDIDSLRNRVPSGPTTQTDLGDMRLSSIEERVPVQNAKDRLDEIVSDIPIPSCQSDLRDSLDDIDILSCADVTDFYSGISRDIRSVEQNAQSLQGRINTGDIGNPRDRIRELRSESDNIQQRINDIEENVSGEERDCLEQLRSRLEDLRSRLNRLDSGAFDLDCGDVPGGLNRRVNSFADEIRNVTRSGATLRPTDADRRIEEARDLRTDVRQRVDDANPCKSDLLSTVESSISDIRGSRSQTCTDKYPELDNRVDEIEGSVVNLGSGVSEPEIQQVREQIESFINTMDSRISDDDRECFNMFNDRIQSSLDRLGQEVSSVRVIQSIGEEARQRQQEQIEELREQLGQISGRAESIIDRARQQQ